MSNIRKYLDVTDIVVTGATCAHI